jgi:hypothetical protein
MKDKVDKYLTEQGRLDPGVIVSFRLGGVGGEYQLAIVERVKFGSPHEEYKYVSKNKRLFITGVYSQSGGLAGVRPRDISNLEDSEYTFIKFI